MVAVPELPEEPALVPQCLADAGYFESVHVTAEDRERGGFYRSMAQYRSGRAQATDLGSYLESLEMRLLWQRFDTGNLRRTHQLINKTNQFNLTAQRYTEAELQEIMRDRSAFGLQFRLTDRFGDNGIIAVVIGRVRPDRTAELEAWLMSCRVIGRQVEVAMLNVVADVARRSGAARLVGRYHPTGRNQMVASFYPDRGFEPVTPDQTTQRFVLSLDGWRPSSTPIALAEVADAGP